MFKYIYPDHRYVRHQSRTEWLTAKSTHNRNWRREREEELEKKLQEIKLMSLGAWGVLLIILSIPLWLFAFVPEISIHFDRGGAIYSLLALYTPLFMYREFRKATWLSLKMLLWG